MTEDAKRSGGLTLSVVPSRPFDEYVPAATLPVVPPRPLTSKSKRAFDVLAATSLLAVFAPVWLIVAALIKLTSPGPVLFRQQRLCAGGRTFVLYKFRTMQDGASDEVHRAYVTGLIRSEHQKRITERSAVYKLAGDGRITRIGRFLRKTSLDEVPQLLNVLKGEMSLIGPRPPIPYEVEHYEPWQLERLSVRPGISGLWQVSGRNHLTYNEMCRLDIDYIRNWSFRRDLVIAVRTPWVMILNGGGAL